MLIINVKRLIFAKTGVILFFGRQMETVAIIDPDQLTGEALFSYIQTHGMELSLGQLYDRTALAPLDELDQRLGEHARNISITPVSTDNDPGNVIVRITAKDASSFRADLA